MNSSLNDAPTGPKLRPLSQETLSDEEMAGYAHEFELVFTQPGVRNIALSGSPAADKAAVVSSWKARHEPRTWLDVSLPRFNRDSSNVTAGEAEDALINQIVCQMDVLKSPKTRFRNMMKRNHALDAVIGAVFAAFVALTILLVWIAGLLPSSRPAPLLCALALLAWLACIGFGIFQIVRTNALGRLLSRLRRNGNDIELAAGPNDSRIERYMGDLVYLLDTNDFDNIVFDGLDTYGHLPMFERLRALNALANSQRDGRRAPLRFFYLVSDGAFDDPHERAAFFDYIIPIIPYIDSANVLAQFNTGLSDIGLDVDENFLSELSQFIDEPRILRDIVNEAHHYKAGLFGEGGATEGDFERLVALLTYKALFPRDFELLQSGQGYLNALLKSRTAIIAEMHSRNARSAQQLSEKLTAAEAQGDADKAAALQATLTQLERDDLECSRKPLASLLADMNDPQPVFSNPPAQPTPDAGYLNRILSSPYFGFIQSAILNGWIDETYERFMSDFYAESLSADDRELISSINQGLPVRADRTVDNPFSVVSHLEADVFARASARVFALLSHLLASGPTDKLESMLRGVRHDGDLDWLLSYTESRQYNGAVFPAIERILDGPVKSILADENVEVARKRRFCHRMLSSGAEALFDAEASGALRSFAQEDPKFLHVECVAPISIAEGLERIGYRPSELDCAGCDQELLQFVYSHDLYDPTASVVDNLLSSLLGAETAIPSGFLVTRVYSLTDTAVKEVVEDNIERFISTLIESTPVKLVDTPEAIAWVLNSEDLPPKRALGYLKALGDDVIIDWLATVENYTYQGILLDRGFVTNTPANILDYYTSAGNIVDEHLAAHLMANPFPDDFTMATTEGHLGTESGFLKAVIECDGLSDEKVDEIAQIYRAQFNHFDMDGISESRMKLLIMNGTIRVTADNLRFVRQNCPAAATCFAQLDIEAYIELVLPGDDGKGGECGFVRNEVLDIFEMDDVADAGKIALLAGFSEPVSLSTRYPDELNAAIASRNFNANDLPLINDLYATGNRKLKRALAETAVRNRAQLSDARILLTMEMVADVAWRLRETRPDMVGFIAKQLANRDPAPTRLEVRTVFERADMKEYMVLMAGPSSVIPDTPEDNALIEALAELGMAGKQSGKTDWQGLRRINSKGYTRK